MSRADTNTYIPKEVREEWKKDARITTLEKEINKKADWNMEAHERITTLEAENAKLREAAQAVVDDVDAFYNARPKSIDNLAAALEKT
jgi:hypothetical protein